MSDRDYMRSEWGQTSRPSFWSTYPGTKGVIVGLIVAHLVRLVAPPSFWHLFALHPEAVLKDLWVWQLVTGGLLHTDQWHLLWNCVAIYFFGRVVEQRLGVRRFLVFALVASIAAGLAYLAWSVAIDSVVPALGASGAAMGMIALAALWYPHMTVMLFMVFPMQLWVLAAILVLLDVFGALGSGPGGVAHTAHLGGALYGWLYFRYGAKMGGMFGAIDRLVDEKKRKKERRDQVRELELRAEVDRILDKVNREGMNALTDAERRFLKDASDRLRG